MTNEKIDVAVMTYNSGKYLDEALKNVFRAVRVKNLIAIDHYSQDGTLEILRKYDAKIFFESVGLGYARQLAISKVSTSIFMFLDSDLIFKPPFNWFDTAMKTLEENEDLGAIVMRVSQYHVDLNTPRAQYHKFWHRLVPQTKKVGFTTGSTFIKTSAVEGVKIPSALDAREDRYLELFILTEKKLRIEYYLCNGIHFFDHARDKGSWTGANERILTGLRYFPYLLVRRIIFSPLKAIPPMVVYRNPKILFYNSRLWFEYLKGFLEPMKYRKLKR